MLGGRIQLSWVQVTRGKPFVKISFISSSDRHAATSCQRLRSAGSMDFVSNRLLHGRWFRVLTVVDQFTRECLVLLVDSSLSGTKVAQALSEIVAERGAQASITVDNGTEFQSKAMDVWAYQHGVQLDFIRPGRPTENGYIESFNGRLRDECLNVQVFFSVADARDKLERWRQDYNRVRPHSALGDSAPEEFASAWQAAATTASSEGLREGFS